MVLYCVSAYDKNTWRPISTKYFINQNRALDLLDEKALEHDLPRVSEDEVWDGGVIMRELDYTVIRYYQITTED